MADEAAAAGAQAGTELVGELASAEAAAAADATAAAQAADLGAFTEAVLRTRTYSIERMRASSSAKDDRTVAPPPIGLLVPRVLPRQTLLGGIEVKKYPRRKCFSAGPSPRTLWLSADGVLCLARGRTAKTTKKAIRLENIASVQAGATSRNFQGLSRRRYRLDVEGKEASCVSISGSGTNGDAGRSFHIKLKSQQAAEELVSHLAEARRGFEAATDAQARRVAAQRYSASSIGRRRVSSADFQGLTHMKFNAQRSAETTPVPSTAIVPAVTATDPTLEANA